MLVMLGDAGEQVQPRGVPPAAVRHALLQVQPPRQPRRPVALPQPYLVRGHEQCEETESLAAGKVPSGGWDGILIMQVRQCSSVGVQEQYRITD